jgi:apolipoprotein N-acyltransferase
MSALAGGLAASASLPPGGWWGALPIAAALLALTLDEQRARARALHGALFGLGWFAPALWWVTSFAPPGYVALVLVSAAVVAASAAATPGRSSALATPAALTVIEMVRLHWPFGGFPLGGLALGQASGPWTGVAPVAGSSAVVLVASATGTAGLVLAHAVARRLRQQRLRDMRSRPLLAAVTLAVLLLAAALPVAPGNRSTQTLTVAAVQGGGPRGIPAVVADAGAVLDRHVQASRQVPADADLVVWPEDVVDIDGPLAGSRQEAVLRSVAAALGRPLVAGVVEDVAPGRFANAAVVVGPDGMPGDRYDKVHRVPFGEYIPGRGVLDRWVDLSLVPKDAVVGKHPPVIRAAGARLGVVISYEVFFPGRAREAVNAGGRLLLVPTNAASFTTPQVPAQELAAARLRAVETARAVVQAAPTGYSALIAPDGRVSELSELGHVAVLTGRLPLSDERTWYVRAGDLPLILTVAAVLIFAWLHRKTGSHPGGEGRVPCLTSNESF